MRWQECLSSKKGKEELSSAERKQEFQIAFMEFESMKNEYYQQQDSNSSDSPNPSSDFSSQQSSLVSRTNSVQSSDSNCPSSISNDTHVSKGHRHFKFPSLSLTPAQFEKRLLDRLPNDVIHRNIITRFEPLSMFREKYILPLSEAYPGQEIELTTISNFDHQRFLSDYVILFVEGCQVKRKVRNLGEKEDQVSKDTKQREMFRDFFKDLWGILGTY